MNTNKERTSTTRAKVSSSSLLAHVLELTLDRGNMDLPIELWVLIFEVATALPEEWAFGSWRSHISPQTIIRPWKEVLKTRRSLVAVSRSFHQLSIPLLYRSFFASTPRQLSCFRWT